MVDSGPEPSRDIGRLLELMARLRTPQSGCPWDLAQSFESIAPYTIEEAYEVADAIARGAIGDLRDELGDLLLQVVFHARMAEELGAFDFGDVVLAITEKLIRRHPHVFDATQDLSPEAVKGLWDKIKAQERAAAGASPRGDVLSGVPLALPALTRAEKLQSRAAKVGFDWDDVHSVLAKVREETNEIEAVLPNGDGRAEEIGDLLFAVVNLARHAGVDPEAALRSANGKFERRFAFIERALAADGRQPQDASLSELDALWDAAKASERGR